MKHKHISVRNYSAKVFSRTFPSVNFAAYRSDGGQEAELLAKLKAEVEKLLKNEDLAKNSDLSAIKTKLEELSTKLSEGVDKAEYEILKQEHVEALAAIKALNETGTNHTPTGKAAILGSVQKFLTETAKLSDKAKNKTAGFEQMTIKAAALMTIESNVVGANGFSVNVNNYIDPEIGHTPKPENFILPLVTVETQSGTEKIWWSERTNEQGDAQFIGEGDLKPLISAQWETKSADIKEVAERWKQSNRMIMHTNRLVADFREHAGELIDQKIDTEVLTGSGVGDELSGIADSASAFIVPTALANYYTFPNIYDAIIAVATQVSLANFKPTDVVLNTVEKAKMQGLKDAEGRYLIPPFVTPSGEEISGLRVTFSNKMPTGKILVGDLKKFKVVFGEDVMYDTGHENDDFSKNLTSFKLEAFLGTYIKTPHIPAIVYDDIATVLTAIGVI